MKAFLLLGLLCLSSVTMAARPAPELDMVTHGEIVIEPDGAVRSWTVEDDKLGPQVQAMLRKNIEGWRFEPVLVDGKPVVAKTRMTLALTATPQGEGYAVKLDQVYFGSLKSRGTAKPPSYPANAIRARLGARVMLAVKLDGEGKVVAVHPYQTSLSQWGSESKARRWRQVFEKASIEAVSKWQYVPGETIGGKVVESSVMVPIVFQIVESGQPRKQGWRAYAPGPVTPAPWVNPDSVAQLDTDRLDEGQAASLDSVFKLKSDVLGKAL